MKEETKKCIVCNKRYVKQQEWKRQYEKKICLTCLSVIDVLSKKIDEYMKTLNPEEQETIITKYKRHFITPREMMVLEKRFGINRQFKTLKEIADEFDVTPERIRQIEAKVIEKVNFWLIKMGK